MHARCLGLFFFFGASCFWYVCVREQILVPFFWYVFIMLILRPADRQCTGSHKSRPSTESLHSFKASLCTFVVGVRKSEQRQKHMLPCQAVGHRKGNKRHTLPLTLTTSVHCWNCVVLKKKWSWFFWFKASFLLCLQL